MKEAQQNPDQGRRRGFAYCPPPTREVDEAARIAGLTDFHPTEFQFGGRTIAALVAGAAIIWAACQWLGLL